MISTVEHDTDDEYQPNPTTTVELREEFSTQNPDAAALLAARTCYMDESPVGMSVNDAVSDVSMDKDVYSHDEQKRKLIKQLIRRGHFSPFEHAKAYFVIEGVSRDCMAQLTRHRHLSFSVQSMRYVDASNFKAKTSPSMIDTVDTYDSEYGDIMGSDVYHDAQRMALRAYNRMIDAGIPQEDARKILPIGTTVNMVVSGNLRAWMHVIDMRNAGDAQWEIRDIVGEIFDQLKEFAPLTFEMYEEHAKGSSKKAP